MSKRPTGRLSRSSVRRKSSVFTLMLALLMISVFLAAPAQAVHDETFQLDGDVDNSTTTSIGGTQDIDWESLFDANGATIEPKPTGFKAAKLDRDFVSSGTTFLTSDTTTFATGSKDTLPISGWQCNFDNNVNSKVDVMNAYAASYTDPTGDQILFFGLERNTNTGDANVAFWFLQDKVACETAGPSTTFSGEHKDGDLLIVSAFSKGGDVSTISVYRWDRPGNPVGVPGSLNTTPVVSGVDCRAGTTPAGDFACAAANTTANGVNGTIQVPWLTSNFKDKVGNQLLTGEFFEGGLNLTDSGLGGKCFNTFIGDTRSSTSLTSTLFDYAGGQLGECTSDTVTTPSIATPTRIDADGVMSVTDSALVTVSGVPVFSGTVNFYLCGPFDASSTQRCNNDPLDPDTAGVAAGSSSLTDVASPQTVTSSSMNITSAGRYCWRAEFSGDAERGVPGSSDSRESECFLITPRQSELTTQAGAGPVDFGNAVTDTADLQNTANQPGTGGPAGSTDGSVNPSTAGLAAGGTITFKLYGPDSCSTLAEGFPIDGISRDVSGNGTYPTASQAAVSFVPQAPGTYHWKASYSGDLPNTLSISHNDACTDSNESVVVRRIETEITTAPSYFPQDSATITSSVVGDNLPANGTVTFSLYGASTGVTALANCQAAGTTGRVYGPEAVSTGAAAHSATVGTANTTVRITATGRYYWLVTYAPGDTAHTGIQSRCTENIDATLTGDAGPGTAFP